MNYQVGANTADRIPDKDWTLIAEALLHYLMMWLQPLVSEVASGTVLLCRVFPGPANLVTVSEYFLVAPLTLKSPGSTANHARRGVVTQTDTRALWIGLRWLG